MHFAHFDGQAENQLSVHYLNAVLVARALATWTGSECIVVCARCPCPVKVDSGQVRRLPGEALFSGGNCYHHVVPLLDTLWLFASVRGQRSTGDVESGEWRPSWLQTYMYIEWMLEISSAGAECAVWRPCASNRI